MKVLRQKLEKERKTFNTPRKGYTHLAVSNKHFLLDLNQFQYSTHVKIGNYNFGPGRRKEL